MMNGGKSESKRKSIQHQQICETCRISFTTQEGSNVTLLVCLGILIKDIFPNTGFDFSQLLKEPQEKLEYKTIEISRPIANKIKDNLEEFNYFTDFNLSTTGFCCKIEYWA